MPPTGSVSFTGNAGGVNLNRTVSRTASLVNSAQTNLGAAADGTLTTRTDNTTGTLTMSAGHGITTGAKIDIYWKGGLRTEVVVGTVSGNSVPFSGGGGTNLPIATTVVTASLITTIDFLATIPSGGAAMWSLFCAARGRASFWNTDPAEVLALNLDGVKPANYVSGGGFTDPLATESIETIHCSQSSTAPVEFDAAILYDG